MVKTIESLYARGESSERIAALLNLTPEAVKREAVRTLNRWKRQLFTAPRSRIALEFGKIDALETAYWELIEAEKPDPRLLQGVERCIELRLKLLRVDTLPEPACGKPEPKVDLSALSDAALKELAALYARPKRGALSKPEKP